MNKLPKMFCQRRKSDTKNGYYITHLHELSRKDEYIEIESRDRKWLSGAGGKKQGVTANGYKVSFGDDRNIQKLVGVMVAQLCNLLKITEFYSKNRWIYGMKLYLNKTV